MDKPLGTSSALKPSPGWLSVFLFGVPAAVMFVSVYFLIPRLAGWGLSEYMSLLLASLVPFLGMFIASLVAYRLEQREWHWMAFRQRMRLTKMGGRDWLWTVALMVFAFASYLLLRSAIAGMLKRGVLVLPEGIPGIIDPRVSQSIESLAGGPLKGNWSLALVSAAVLFFNIFGEELWWRGYILPRQELVYGDKTWFFHGLLWAFFHIFKYWEIIAVLPTCLALSYVAQRTRNSWPGIVAHMAINSLGSVGILILVIGAG